MNERRSGFDRRSRFIPEHVNPIVPMLVMAAYGFAIGFIAGILTAKGW